jgi:hypothetical protein
MKCPQCAQEVNPTLVYCSNCGIPLDVDVTDVLEDAEKKREESRIITAVRDAKGLFVAGAFTLVCVLALRWAFLDARTYDVTPAFRTPYKVIEETAIDPPQGLQVEAVKLPFPAEVSGQDRRERQR